MFLLYCFAALPRREVKRKHLGDNAANFTVNLQFVLFIVCVRTNVIRFNSEGINTKKYIQKAEIRGKVNYSTDQDQNASHTVKLGIYDKTTGVLISKEVLLGRDPTWKVFMVRSAVVRWLRSPHTIARVRVEVLPDSDAQKRVPKVLMHGGRSGPFLVVYTDTRLLQGVEDNPFIRE